MQAQAIARPRAEGDAKSDPRTAQSKAIDAEMEKLWNTFNSFTKPYGDFENDAEAWHTFIEKVYEVDDQINQLATQSDSLMNAQNEIVDALMDDYPDEDATTFCNGYSGIGEVETII